MSDLYWLTDAQMGRLEPFFPKSHGKPRVHCPAGYCVAMSREGMTGACSAGLSSSIAMG